MLDNGNTISGFDPWTTREAVDWTSLRGQALLYTLTDHLVSSSVKAIIRKLHTPLGAIERC